MQNVKKETHADLARLQVSMTNATLNEREVNGLKSKYQDWMAKYLGGEQGLPSYFEYNNIELPGGRLPELPDGYRFEMEPVIAGIPGNLGVEMLTVRVTFVRGTQRSSLTLVPTNELSPSTEHDNYTTGYQNGEKSVIAFTERGFLEALHADREMQNSWIPDLAADMQEILKKQKAEQKD